MKQYINNLETGHIELHFEKCEYMALSQEQKDELKRFFSWSKYSTAWVSKGTKDHYWALQIAAKLGFTEEEKQGKRLSFAEEVERKAEKAEHRAERMEEHAENAEKRAQQLQSEFNKYRQDWSWLTQPIISGHAGSQRFGRQRQAVIDRYDKGFEEYRKSDYFKERAETARGTASMAQFENAVYVDSRIRECEKAIRDLSKLIGQYEDTLYRVENGEEMKNYHGEIITAEIVQNRLKELIEKAEYQIDKRAYLENAMDAIRAAGRKIYTPDDIKPGYRVKIRGSWCTVLSLGPKNVNAKHDCVPYGITYPYAEVQEVKIPEGWEEPKQEAHNVKEGEIFTRDYIGGDKIRSAYQVIKTSDKTVQVKEIKVVENKPVLNAFISDKAERKSVKKDRQNNTVLNDGDWYLHRYAVK
jgi:hypothetical protein